MSKKLLGVTLAGTLAIGSIGLTNLDQEEAEAKKGAKVKNVIVLVKDGVSSSTTTLSRWYKGSDLAMDEMAAGGVRTYSADSAITDSAPAGTAMATGNKSNDKFVGVLPEKITSPGVDEDLADDPYRPVTNVLEGAKTKGKATGLISTSEIQHATPAAFSSHAEHRQQYDNIAEQQVYQNIDVVLGGGKETLESGNRKDGENLLEVIDNRGYDFVETREDLLNSGSKKIWGSFAPAALAYDMDKEVTQPEEPTLAEMTKKGIQTLSKDKDGFFLFVEGSKPDWAAHANDPVGMVSDTLAFDDAVKEALDFAKKDKHTMVIAVSDHGNSGISIGNENTDGTYSSTPVSAYVDPLKEAKMTVEGALSQLNEDGSNRLEVAALYGITNPTKKEKRAINKAEDLGGTLVDLLAQRANLGFTTGGHTGEDVFLYSYGPGKPSGMIQNTDIAHSAADAMGFKLDKLSRNMFIEAEDAFGNWGEVSVDTSNEANPVLVVDRGRKKAQFPVNKNIAIVNDREYELDSVTVQSGGKFYVSKEAVKIVKRAK
ncbi:alkaline phosphatase [Terribacillus sp. DMT04]|uniref:alkaline phosphatase n=1 Tax=Terribacillus sp. DMT04 TaxID=2850441 RepID=UPI0020B7C8E2|nr:alkaline phosphatase [Terribacillus sp. DMT04]